MYHTCEEPRCHSTNSNGYGVFTVTDARLEDAGIYSCEAINNMGRVFVYPETDVIISGKLTYYKSQFEILFYLIKLFDKESKRPKETSTTIVPEDLYDFNCNIFPSKVRK